MGDWKNPENEAISGICQGQGVVGILNDLLQELKPV